MESEKIVFEVDASSYLEQLQQISNRIATLKQRQAEYYAAAKGGHAEAAKSLERVNLQLKNQQQAYAQAQKSALTFAGAQKQGAESMGKSLTAFMQPVSRVTGTLTNLWNRLKGNAARQEKLQQDMAASTAAYYDEQLEMKMVNLQREEQLETQAIERSTGLEEEKQAKILAVRLKYLQLQLGVAKQMAVAGGDFTEEEIKNIERLESTLALLQQKISAPGGTAGETGKGQPATLLNAFGINAEAVAEAEGYISRIQNSFQQVAGVISAHYSQRMQQIDATTAAEIAAIETTNLSEKEKQKKKTELEKKAAKEKYELELKQFKSNKAMSIIQATISTAQAVMSAMAAPWPASIAFAAIAAATGIAQIAIIAAKKPPAPPKFAKGIIGLPGPGTETSDSIPAYLSKGESVLTAKATKRFAPVLAQMEMAVGNIPNYQYNNGHFANGVIGDGGFYTRHSVNSVQNNFTLQEAIAQGFKQAPTPVVSVQEITRVSNNVNRSVKVSEL